MAVNAGTVYYTVDADTQKAIDAANEMNKSLESVQTTMAKTDQDIKKHIKKWTEAGNTISKTGVVLDQFGNVNDEATAKMQKLMATTESLEKRHIQLSKTAQGVRAGIAGIGRGAGQAGIQVQQFVGQIQGGQSAMLALSQQSADLGFVLGAPLLGAVIGISASLAGMLLPSLFDSKDATEELENSLKSIEKVIKLNSDGVNVLSNDYAELVKKSKDLATAQLLLTKVKVDQVMNQAADAAEQAFDKFDTFFNALDVSANVSVFENLDATMQRTGKSVIDLIENTDLYGTGLTQLKSAIENVNDELGLTTDQSALVLHRFAEFRQQKTPEAFQALSNTLLNIANTSRSKVSPEFVELTSLISNQAFAAADAAEKSRLLEKALNGIGVETESGVKALKQWDDLAERLRVGTKSLRSEQLKLEKTITLRKAAEEGASQATIDSISSSYDKKIASEQEAEAERKLAKAKRDIASAEREAQKAKQKALDEDQDAANVMIKLKREHERSKSLLGQVDPISGEQQRYQLELDNLKALNEAKLLEDQRYLDLKSQAETEHEKNMMALREENFRRQSEANEFLMDSIDILGRAGTTAIAGMLSGTMSLNEAISNMANTILQQAVGALVEMGLQYVKNQIIGQAAADASAAASIATGMATSAALTAAYSTPAMLASIASYGGAAIAGEAAYLQALTTGKVAALSGMAHDGISSVPNEGTWLLNKGERVYTNDSAQQLDQMYMRVMKPSYPSLPNASSERSSQSEPQVNFSMQVINGAAADGYQVKQEVTEDGVKLLIAKYFDQNIDKGVSSVLGKKGTKTNKTLTSRYDTRNKL